MDAAKRLFAFYGWLFPLSEEEYYTNGWIYEDSDEEDGTIIAFNRYTGEFRYVLEEGDNNGSLYK